MQVEILAVLEPAVGVGEGQRALHLLCNREARGIREIVHRKHHDVIPDADPAVLAPETLEGYHRALLRLCVWTYVARLETLRRDADLGAVLEYRSIRWQCHDRDLVPERHALVRVYLDRRVVVHEDAFDVLAGVDVDDGDPDMVAALVDQELVAHAYLRGVTSWMSALSS